LQHIPDIEKGIKIIAKDELRKVLKVFLLLSCASCMASYYQEEKRRASDIQSAGCVVIGILNAWSK
jgi:hypothetical protein